MLIEIQYLLDPASATRDPDNEPLPPEPAQPAAEA
jgi:hypothetical protein